MAAIIIGCLWVGMWLAIRSGFIPLPPREELRFGWRLPWSQRSARLLGYAGLGLIGFGVVTLVV